MLERPRNLFHTVSGDGVLFPHDFLRQIIQRETQFEGLSEASYHLDGEKLNEAISRSWIRLLQKWHFAYDANCADKFCKELKEAWLFPLFSELGYGRLPSIKPLERDGKKYPISHLWEHLPIHLVTSLDELDTYHSLSRRNIGRQSSHTLVQEFLNHSDEHIWGIVTNGLHLRLLCRNKRLLHRTFLDFDLETMMQSESYSDFTLLWLLCHQSRFEGELAENCWLERWSRVAHAQGERALGQLRSGVEKAVRLLGQGFLNCRANMDLREKLASGILSTETYYRYLLRLIYRLIVLFVAEDRELLSIPDADPKAKKRYMRYYSTAHLRHLAQKVHGTQHTDLFTGFQQIIQRLAQGPECHGLALPVLDGFLFKQDPLIDLQQCKLTNAVFLEALRSLAFLNQRNGLMPIDYQHIGAEELGSIYESLLELRALVERDSFHFRLEALPGNRRKTSGAYWTPSELVEQLLKTALDPVLDRACQQPETEQAILALKICDPACGSGHFLIAAARRMAYRLAFARAGKVEPDRLTWCQALHDVIRNCIYGVDNDIRALEVCMVGLCIEAMIPGRPLIFLDHNLRHGNSLVGVTPRLLREGIPDDAFIALEGDMPQLCQEYRKRNREGLRGQLHLLIEPMDETMEQIVNLRSCSDTTYSEVLEMKQNHDALRKRREYLQNKLVADAWCAAFVWRKVYIASQRSDYPFTHGILREMLDNKHLYSEMRQEIERLTKQYLFFHWHLEFPDIFRIPDDGEEPDNPQAGWSGGFDVVLSNPPWERIKLQEKEWFAAYPAITEAPNAAARRKMIAALQHSDSELYNAFMDDQRQAAGESHFIRHSGRYPFCGRGDVNRYAIFVENMRWIVGTTGHVGCIVPSGMATDDTTKFFFQDLTKSQSLVSFFSFINEAKLFPSIDHRVNYALLTISGTAVKNKAADFAFGIYRVSDLSETPRHFELSAADIALLNPNTYTCPTFHSKRDMELTKAIYERIPVLLKEGKPEGNPWGISFKRMFDMTNDSHLFHTREQLEADGWRLKGNIFHKNREVCQPLYEGKMIWLFDHRFGTYDGQTQAQANQGKLPELTQGQHIDPYQMPLPQYWVYEKHFPKIMSDGRNAFLAFRDITSAAVLRTAIFSLIPVVPCGNNLPIALIESKYRRELAFFLASLSSFAFDYVARQKVGGTHINFFIANQLPVLSPQQYQPPCPWDSTHSIGDWMLPRALELTYTAWDLEAFAKDCGYHGPPFRWDEKRRFLLRCELDAAYFHLYGIGREDVDYIMNTFRVWREKEERQFGEYRTKRMILEIYDEMALAIENGQTYSTRLMPEPADPALANVVAQQHAS
jgi:hypothetical protein